MMAVYGFKVTIPVYIIIKNEIKLLQRNSENNIWFRKNSRHMHLRLVYSVGLGQSKEEREEEKPSYMRLRDYFEKSRRVRVTDGCR